MLIYIHGFNSSALSIKAQQISSWCKQNRSDIRVEVPSLACYPEQAMEQLKHLVESSQNRYRIGLIGSSLGGYYATWLNDKYLCRAVLINPAVAPFSLLINYLGPQLNPYTKEKYVLEPHHMDELKAFDVQSIVDPASLWLLQQQADEVLDYRCAVAKYQKCKQTVEAGGNHSFVGFDKYLADIIQFLEL